MIRPVLIAGLALCLLACSQESDSPEIPIVVGAEPPSLMAGETISAVLTASEPFFANDVTTAITSNRGLTLESLTAQSDTKATAVFTAGADTLVGAHDFFLSQDGETAQLYMSVIAEPPGPGTVTGEGTTATAGAHMATLTIFGQGTHFDAECFVTVEGADGFHIEHVDVVTEMQIEVTYSIDLEQEAGPATVVLMDGVMRYDIPFAILTPEHYQSTAAGQYLTKGRAGVIALAHPEANLSSDTELTVQGDAFEQGPSEEIGDGEVHIPVRVPFDFTSNQLTLTATTYSDGGATLELMETTVTLHDPAYIALSPSRLVNTPGEQSVDIVAHGIDLTETDALSLEDSDQISLTSWSPESATTGTAVFEVASSSADGTYTLVVEEGQREVIGQVVIPNWFGHATHEAESQVATGDELFVSLVVIGGDLVEEDAALAGEDDIEVQDLVFIDQGCVIARLVVTDDAYEGSRTLVLSSGSEQFDVELEIVESGI